MFIGVEPCCKDRSAVVALRSHARRPPVVPLIRLRFTYVHLEGNSSVRARTDDLFTLTETNRRIANRMKSFRCSLLALVGLFCAWIEKYALVNGSYEGGIGKGQR